MNEFHSYRRAERAGIARWFFVATFLVLVVAFFRTQVVQHERFRVRAEKNRLRIVPLVAPRGIIYDRNGLIIAENVPGYAIKLLAPSQDSLHAVLARFREVVPLDTVEVAGIMTRYRQAPYQPVLVVGNGTFEMVSRLEEHRAVLPGLVIQSEPRRYYPDGPAVAHLVGYVGEVSERDLESDRFPGAQLGTVVGRAGLEQEYDKELRGRPGVHYVEVNARGRLVREENVAPALAAIPGEAIRTTIDLPLQRYIDSLWQAAAPGVRGSMVALTPSGEVLALYSAPGYDPNAFVGGISTEEWRRLNDDPARPLLDRAIQTRYPPASPFKLATAAMALKRGIATFTTHMPEPCRGGLQVGNRYFRCWKPEGHGNLDLEGAIAKSCDVYFYQLGLRIGLDAILSDGVLMGFRERSGIDLENEIAPIYPSNAAYFDRKYGPRGWSKWGATLNFSIGQGENTQNVINMTRFYAALASGGEAPTPYIVRPRSDQVRDLGLTPEQLAGIRSALIAVVERGTAAASRTFDLSIAGKTGTAQNSHGEDHGWYVGFAPAEKPEIIVGSIMEFAEHGSNVAPFVNKVLHRYVAGPGVPASPALIALPADSAPRSMQIVPDSTPQVDPVADDTVLPPPPGAFWSMRDLGPDRPLLVVTFLLAAYGLLTLYSAGQTDVVTQAQGVWLRQLVWMAIGVVAMAVVFRFSFRLVEWLAPAAYTVAIVLLLLTLAVGTGQGTAASSKSWLAIGGHQIGQPAELAKVAVILMLARYLSGLRDSPRNLRELIGPCLIAGVPFLLVLKQPDLGSAIVFVGILFLMLFWSGVKPSLLFMLASPGLSLLLAFNTWTWGLWMILLAVLLFVWRPYVVEGVFLYVVNSVMGALAIPLWQRLAPYQQNRLLTFLNPEIDPRAAGYHAIQSRVAIGSGGWFGNGFTDGPQKRLAFLPAQHTDFIFSVVGEELGFVGVLLALILFLLLFLVLLRIARRATDPFASLVVFGILALFFTHVFENVGMTVNLMPITGIPLPFFSYGGSFFLVCCMSIGLVLRAAWDARLSGYADV